MVNSDSIEESLAELMYNLKLFRRQNLRLGDVAELLGLSVDVLENWFSESRWHSFSNYLSELRLYNYLDARGRY